MSWHPAHLESSRTTVCTRPLRRSMWRRRAGRAWRGRCRESSWSSLSPRGTPGLLLGAGFEPHEGPDRPTQLGIHSRSVLGDGGWLLARWDLPALCSQQLLQTVDPLEDSWHAPMPRLWTLPTWPFHATSPFRGIHTAP